MSESQTQFPLLFLFSRSLFYCPPTRISFLALIEIIYPIDIDNLPPLHPKNISSKTRDDPHKKMCRRREKDIGDTDYILESYHTIAYQYDDSRKIDKLEYHHEEECHEEEIE